MRPRRLWRTPSLRARLMFIGVFGLALGLLLGGVLLVSALGQTIYGTADNEALRTAESMASLAGADSLPDPLPVAGDDVRAQLVDPQGRVIAASGNADRLVPFLYADERPATGQSVRRFVPGSRLGLDGPVRVVAVPANTPDGPRTVLVAKSLADLNRSVHLLRVGLLVAFPLLLLVLAAVAWRVIGATLRPVEALRSGAESVTGGERLPVPAANDEIHRLAVTLNGMLDRLEAARARQRTFVADAAHELRSPLTNMRTQLEVAQHIGDASLWPAVADDLLADVHRLSRLVDDLLLLARSDDPLAPAPVTGPVELGGLLKTVGGRYASPPVSVSLPDGPLWTEGDEAGLERVLGNLVDNAVRHARSSVVLAAAPSDDADWCVVTVTDDGPGVAESDRERVFDRFTRLDDARARDAGGAGLGLSIVRELMQRHHGTVRLLPATPDDGGLRAEVRLPVAPAAA
jgi:signal transduction histidine kinase